MTYSNLSRAIFFSAIEVAVYVIIIPVLWIYIVFMYYESSEISKIILSLLLISPVISACVSSYLYEQKYKEFISLLTLLKVSAILLVPHMFISAVLLILLPDNDLNVSCYTHAYT